MPSVFPDAVRHHKVRITSASALIALFLAGPLAGSAQAAATVVPLGTASAFSVLAGSTVTNTGATTIERSVGVSPGTAITGGSTMVVGGTYHSADAVAAQAKVDLTAAYGNAAGQKPRIASDAELGGETLVGGVYTRPTTADMGLTGVLTLDGDNNPDSVWVFQAGRALTVGSAASVVLINGANPCNVFWQVSSSATLGTTSSFVGTIMADQSITMNTGATLQGRVLARIAAVNLHNNVITTPDCADDVDVPDGTTTPPATGGTGGTGTGGTGSDTTDTTGTTGGAGAGEDQVKTTPTGAVDTGYAGPLASSDAVHQGLVSWTAAAAFAGGMALVGVRRRRRV
jgi:hypothetical protein